MDCICDKFVMVEDGEVFEMSQAAKGDPGPGVAPGGTTGQLLAKASDEDYDTEWIDQPEMDAEHVSYDSTETYSDGTVGKELGTINSALTSLSAVTEIIDTASGAIASFPDGSGLPMRSLVAQINPVQAGTGDPSPDKIRPITGHTGLSVEVRGGNLLDKTGAVRGGFDASGNVLVNSGDSRCVTVFLEVKPNVTYYIDKTIPLTQGRAGFWYDANQTAISQISFNGAGASSGAVTSPANAKYCRLGYLATNEDVCTMTVGTSALTPYEPYNAGETITISWQDEAGTVYVGTVDLISGELIVDKVLKTLSNSLAWSTYSAWANVFYVSFDVEQAVKGVTPLSGGDGNNCLCDKYIGVYSNITTIPNNSFVHNSTSISSSIESIAIKDERFSVAEDFKASFTEIQLVYPLAEPLVYQLTPQQIETLIGNNTVLVNTGDVSVTYQASLKGYIDKVLGS